MSVKVDDAIAAHLKLRRMIEEVKERHATELAPLNEKKIKLESFLLAFLHTAGAQSIAAKGIGTAFKQDVVSVTVKDWEAALGWVKQHNGWEFLERRFSKSAVQEYAEAQNQLPPGIDMTTTVEVRVRKA